MSVRIVLAALFSTGCIGSGASDAPDAGDTGTRFTRAQALLAGEALGAEIEDAAKRYGPVMPGAGVDAQCATPSGDTSDADGDSIPANATLTFDCSERRFGYTGTLTGTEVVSDLLPNAVAWAFSAATDLHASLTGPFGGSAVVDTDGSIVASQASIVGPFVLTSALDVITVITNVRGQQAEITEAIDWTISFRPELAWTPGDVVVTGSLTADGAWTVGVDGVSGAATVSTPTPVTLVPSCDTLVTAGLVEATFAGGARAESITVQWSGCGQRTVTYP